MITFVLALLLNISTLQNGGSKAPAAGNENQKTTTTTTTTTAPTTGTSKIGSGGWDDRD